MNHYSNISSSISQLDSLILQFKTDTEKIKNQIIYSPPLSEQKAIADYLDNKCAEIERIIADKKSQIETLDGYKKSLIYEYVTGKKEVR